MSEKYITYNDLARLLSISRQAIQKQLKGKINSGKVKTKIQGRTEQILYSSLPNSIKKRIENEKEKAAKKILKISKKGKKDLNFEKELWEAADKLRGNIDPSDYKHIVLGLIFLKYISDSFYQRRLKLTKIMADKKNKEYYVSNKNIRKRFLEEKDFYTREGIFYIPENARWEYLRKKASLPDIDKYIDDAMEAIEKENPQQLSGVLPKNYVQIPLESHILGELVNIFSRIDFGDDEKKEKDILGLIYEYFLGQFASAEGKRGGEFYTPRPIVKLLIEILEPYEGSRVLDPACGSGGMFVQSNKFLQEHHKNPNKISIYGQESNPTTVKLCKMNLAIRGVFGNIQLGNSYYDDKFPDLKADFVLANPPFNADWDPNRLSDKDPRIVYGIPPKSNANFMWIQHFFYHLTPGGMAGFVMANGALAVSGKEGEIRKKIVEDDLIDVIIACPPKLFFNVSLPVSLWFLTKNKESGRFRKRKGETLLIDASQVYEQVSRKQIIFTEEQIRKIANTVKAWRGEEGTDKYEDVPGFCKAVKIEEIVKNGSALNPGRYVGIPEEKDDGIPFEEKMKSLEKDLKDCLKESEQLEKEILKNLTNLKHG